MAQRHYGDTCLVCIDARYCRITQADGTVIRLFLDGPTIPTNFTHSPTDCNSSGNESETDCTVTLNCGTNVVSTECCSSCIEEVSNGTVTATCESTVLQLMIATLCGDQEIFLPVRGGGGNIEGIEFNKKNDKYLDYVNKMLDKIENIEGRNNEVKDKIYETCHLFPNPSKDILSLKFNHRFSDHFYPESVTICNYLGAIVQKETFAGITTSEIWKLNVQALEKGAHVLIIEYSSGLLETKNFVKF